MKLALVIPSTEKVIQQRASLGRGYANGTLEDKRQAAITYLRRCSRQGWIVDRVLRRKP